MALRRDIGLGIAVKLEQNLVTYVELAAVACIVGCLLYVAGRFACMFYVEARGNRDRLALARAAAGVAIALGGTAAALSTPNPTMPIKTVAFPSHGR